MVLFRKYTGNDEKYFNLSECEKGQVLVTGKYLGSRVGRKFGNQEFEFRDDESGKIVVLTGGHLKHLLEKSHLKEGGICRIIFAGDAVLASGKFKGKATHTYELEVAEDEAAVPQPVQEKKPWEVSDDDLRV